jgi:hypothetical protein
MDLCLKGCSLKNKLDMYLEQFSSVSINGIYCTIKLTSYSY